MQFRVQLDVYLGPLDLLLYLVRKHEVDVVDIPIAAVTDQFLEYLTVLEKIDVDSIGDFLEMATMLMEIKSRLVLPGDEEVEEELDDPRKELVRRLLEFKQFRDAASVLEERGREWRDRYVRQSNDLPPRPQSADEQPIKELELWDLVSAFGRVLKEKMVVNGPANIRYDETPIHVYMKQIDGRLRTERRIEFATLFEGAVHKSGYVGMFLAMLELLRHHYAQAAQQDLFGPIWLEPGECELPTELDVVAEYDHSQADDAV